jgi:hypothetical protein
MELDTVLDLNWLKSATYEDMKTVLRIAAQHPDKMATVNALLATPEGAAIAQEMINDPDYVPVSKRVPTAEEQLQIDADVALAEKQAADAAAAEAAEKEATAAAAVVAPVVPVPVPIEEKKKIVVQYQATAEDGTPIGRPTHIEGWSHEEIIEKMKVAHINAVRYAERVKRNRAQSTEALAQIQQTRKQNEQTEVEATAAVEVAAKEKDPAKLRDAISKVSKAERDAQIAQQTEFESGKIIGDIWMADHKEDFLPCQANSKIIGDWLKANNLRLSYDNLEAAFMAEQKRLAKPVHQAIVEEVSATPAPNAPVVAPVAPVAPVVAAPPIPAPTAPVAVPVTAPVLMPAAPVSQPVVAAPSSTPAVAPNAQPAARRPGVNGGLQPGSLTAARPVVEVIPQTTTREALLKEIDKMSPKEFRKKVTTSKEYRERLIAAGIPVLGNYTAAQ